MGIHRVKTVKIAWIFAYRDYHSNRTSCLLHEKVIYYALPCWIIKVESFVSLSKIMSCGGRFVCLAGCL